MTFHEEAREVERVCKSQNWHLSLEYGSGCWHWWIIDEEHSAKIVARSNSQSLDGLLAFLCQWSRQALPTMEDDELKKLESAAAKGSDADAKQ